MKEIQKLPSDKNIWMTAKLHRLFNAAGCDPACHCCNKLIPVGAKFQLGTISVAPKRQATYPESFKAAKTEYENGNTESKEVMLCDQCTPEKYKQKVLDALESNQKFFAENPRLQGCFRINGKFSKV